MHALHSRFSYHSHRRLALYVALLVLLLGGSLIVRQVALANGQWTDIAADIYNMSSGKLYWGDYDNDGELNLLSTGLDPRYPASTRLYKNTNGTFSDSGMSLPRVEYGAAAWGDYDNDGDLDLVLTGQTASYPTQQLITRVLRNDNGAFMSIQINSSLLRPTSNSCSI